MSTKEPSPLAWYDRPSVPALVREVVELARCGVAGSNNIPSARIAELLAVGRLLAVGDDQSQRSLVTLVLDAVLGADSAWMRNHHQRSAASELIGHSHLTYDMPYRDRVARVADDYYHQASETFRREDRNGKLPPLLREVADAVSRLSTALSDTDSVGLNPGEEPDYISRPELETEVALRVKSGVIAFLLLGDAGVGKSTLAKHLATKVGGSSAGTLIIRAGNTRTMMEDIARYLHSRGLDTSRHEAVLKDEFRRLLEGERPPRAVILDNAVDPDELLELIPRNSASRLFITSTNARATRFPVERVHVPNMTIEQAVDMAARRIPEASDDDVTRLVARLDCRPLAIEHACGYIRESEVTVSDFLAALEGDITAVMEVAKGDPKELTLTAIYRMTLYEIKKTPHAVRLLDFIAFGARPSSLSVLRELWRGPLGESAWERHDRPIDLPAMIEQAKRSLGQQGVNFVDYGEPARATSAASRVIFPSAVRALTNRSIIRVDEETDWVDMHGLTQRLITDLRREDGYDPTQTVIHTAREVLEVGHLPNAQPIPRSWLHWVPFLDRAIEQSGDPGSDENLKADTAWLLAVTLRGHVQVGLVPDSVLEYAISTCKRVYSWNPTELSEEITAQRGRAALRAELLYYLSVSGLSAEWTERHRIFLNWLIDDAKSRKGIGFFESRPWFYFCALASDGSYPLHFGFQFNKVRSDTARELQFAASHDDDDIERYVDGGSWELVASRILQDVGRHREAIQAAARAFGLFSNLAGRPSYLKGVVESAMRIADVAIAAGALTQAAEWFNRGITLLNEREDADSLHDKAFITRVSHTRQTIAAAALFREAELIWQREGRLTEEFVEQSRPHLEACRDNFTTYRRIGAHELERGPRRLQADLLAIATPELADLLYLQMIDDYQRTRDHIEVLRCSISGWKVRVRLHLTTSFRLEKSAERKAYKIADLFKRRYHYLYPYVDALSVAYVISLLLRGEHADWTKRVGTELKRAAVNIGRRDKYDTARRALDPMFKGFLLFAP